MEQGRADHVPQVLLAAGGGLGWGAAAAWVDLERWESLWSCLLYISTWWSWNAIDRLSDLMKIICLPNKLAALGWWKMVPLDFLCGSINYLELCPEQLKGLSQKLIFPLKHHCHHASALWDVSWFLCSLVPSISGRVSSHITATTMPAHQKHQFSCHQLWCPVAALWMRSWKDQDHSAVFMSCWTMSVTL